MAQTTDRFNLHRNSDRKEKNYVVVLVVGTSRWGTENLITYFDLFVFWNIEKMRFRTEYFFIGS